MRPHPTEARAQAEVREVLGPGVREGDAVRPRADRLHPNVQTMFMQALVLSAHNCQMALEIWSRVCRVCPLLEQKILGRRIPRT